MVHFSKIVGTGSYLPPKVLTNKNLEAILDTSDEWIKSRTGIHQRHVVEEETSSDLGTIAAQRALAAAGIDAKKLDAIVVATTTPAKVFPSIACTIQHRIGANGCAAFDVQAVCAGFTYALSIADSFIRSGTYRHVLVIGAETMSKLMDWSDRSTCVLFGDGAGAVVLSRDTMPGIIATRLHADGAFEEILHAPLLENPSNASYIAYLRMNGSSVYKIAVKAMGKLVIDVLSESNMAPEELDWLVPHQANIRIIDSIANNLQLNKNQVILTIDKHANTSAASIPLAFDAGIQSGQIKPGQSCLMVAFGGGLSWGAALLRY